MAFQKGESRLTRSYRKDRTPYHHAEVLLPEELDKAKEKVLNNIARLKMRLVDPKAIEHSLQQPVVGLFGNGKHGGNR